MPADDAPVIDWARWYISHGLSVIPVRADGSKAPAVAGWRVYSDRLPADGEVAGWFPDGTRYGLGVVPGAASGNLVVLDFECRDGHPAYAEWAGKRADGLDLAGCPVVRTPSGGRHVWVRLPAPLAGGVLARYADGRVKVEIRGAGHQVLAPGCPAGCHRSGDRYRFESPGWLS